MRITTQIEYGLRCILHIARCGGQDPVSVSEIARGEDLPADYVEQLLLKLRKSGLVKSQRGMHGGYSLARPRADISVKQIIEALEEPVFEVVCNKVKDGKIRCCHLDECSVRPVWVRLFDAVNSVLRHATLEMLLQDEAAMKKDMRQAHLHESPLVTISTGVTPKAA